MTEEAVRQETFTSFMRWLESQDHPPARPAAAAAKPAKPVFSEATQNRLRAFALADKDSGWRR